MAITTDAEAWAWLVKWRSGRPANGGRRAEATLVASGVRVSLERWYPSTYDAKGGQADTLAAAVRKAMAARWE